MRQRHDCAPESAERTVCPRHQQSDPPAKRPICDQVRYQPIR
jgi:hypothetical protein